MTQVTYVSVYVDSDGMHRLTVAPEAWERFKELLETAAASCDSTVEWTFLKGDK